MIFLRMALMSMCLLILIKNSSALSQLPTSSPPSVFSSWSRTIEKMLLDWFKNSELVAKLHAEHVASPQVQHMMKSTQLVQAPEHEKLRFAESFMGRLISDAMAKEQKILGKWKIQKIIEAASSGGGGFDVESGHDQLLKIVEREPVVLFSFVDCPWCLLAKKLLQAEPYNLVVHSGTDAYGGNALLGNRILKVLELEELGWTGKELRASIALATGRTSMPACFIGGRSIGGYTDGFEFYGRRGEDANNSDSENGEIYVPSPNLDLRMCSRDSKITGLKDMHERGLLQALIEKSLE